MYIRPPYRGNTVTGCWATCAASSSSRILYSLNIEKNVRTHAGPGGRCELSELSLSRSRRRRRAADVEHYTAAAAAQVHDDACRFSCGSRFSPPTTTTTTLLYYARVIMQLTYAHVSPLPVHRTAPPTAIWHTPNTLTRVLRIIIMPRYYK